MACGGDVPTSAGGVVVGGMMRLVAPSNRPYTYTTISLISSYIKSRTIQLTLISRLPFFNAPVHTVIQAYFQNGMTRKPPDHLLYSTDLKICNENPCLWGGTCRNTTGVVTCFCPEGFTGNVCETGKSLYYSLNDVYRPPRVIYVHVLNHLVSSYK